jgi:hypothetical protein
VALRILAPAAVVCLLAGGGYAVTRVGSGSKTTGSASSASLPKSQKAAGQAGPGAVSGPIHAGTNGGSGSSGGVAFSAIASGTDYQPGQQLLTQVESELSQHPSGTPATAAIAACVDKVTGGVAPTLVDVARYKGQPATIIAVTHISTSGFAWVMDAGCTKKLAEITLPAAG